ncbi:MAG: hypothetical protein ACNS64_15950 [Candidatus Halalkalibacterium sp. M3_1C_030]
MSGIIDYAGLFPPADLSLDPAIRNYAAYRKSDKGWMLSRFIIPATKLKDLEPYQEEVLMEGEPYPFSVLGSGTDTLNDFKEVIRQVFRSCAEFKQNHGERVTADVVEIKLPKEAVLSGDSELVREVLDIAYGEADDANGLPGYIFFEGYFEESWKKDISTVMEAISVYREKQGENHNMQAGFKLRCGGTEAHMFPDVEEVAYCINACREHDISLKFTAGLHHPVRHYNDSVQTKMHGFFNVFGGALLAFAHDLGNNELEEILKEEDPDQFSFTEESFMWRDLSISADDIRELREVAIISFGSCSFEEPLEDLKSLKLL